MGPRRRRCHSLGYSRTRCSPTGTAPTGLKVGETPKTPHLAAPRVNAHDLTDLEHLTAAAPARMLNPANLGVLELHPSP